MNGADLLVDGFPHGTVAGYKRGCKSSGLCPGGYGQTCTQAQVRSASDWQYGKALAKDREVEFLEREWSAANAAGDDERAAAVVKPAAVMRAAERQRQHQSAPMAPEPETPAVKKSTFAVVPRASMSEIVHGSHARQRDHALATASAEHPLGLALSGEPRKRAAAGTVLVGGKLMRRDGETVAEPQHVVEETPVEDVVEPLVASSTVVAGLHKAATEAERVTALLTDTNWTAVATSLGRLADTLELLQRMSEARS